MGIAPLQNGCPNFIRPRPRIRAPRSTQVRWRWRRDGDGEEILENAADGEELDAVLAVRRDDRDVAADGILGDVQQRPDGDVAADRRELAAHDAAVVALREMARDAIEREIEHGPVRPAAMAAAPRPVIPGARIALDFVRQNRARHAVGRQQEVGGRRVDDDARHDLMVDPFHRRRLLCAPRVFFDCCPILSTFSLPQRISCKQAAESVN